LRRNDEKGGESSNFALDIPIWIAYPIRPFVSSLENLGKGVELVVEVVVRDNNIDQALRALKKKMQREGIFREMKMRKHYEKPSERRVREMGEAVRRARKLARKRSDHND
jgi:small subunit ribosomal protein S21